MPWKLYIDSRKRVKGARGNSDSDFAIQLPYPITVSGKCYADVVLCPNSAYTVRSGQNDRIYLDEVAAQTKRVVTIAAGQYTVYELRDALITALNAGKAITGQYAVTYVSATNRLQISIVNPAATDQYRISTEEYMLTNWAAWTSVAGATGISADNLKSANRPCGFSDGTTIDGTNAVNPLAPNAPDVQPYKQLFIRSSLGGGSNQSLGVNGETDIIRRVVVGNTSINSMIHDVHNTPFDCVQINGTPELSQMWFQVVDIDNQVIDLHGLPISFSIIFQDIDE